MSLLASRIEIWHRYGAYLTGVASLARELPYISLDQFMIAVESSGSWGGWSREAIARTWNAARENSND